MKLISKSWYQQFFCRKYKCFAGITFNASKLADDASAAELTNEWSRRRCVETRMSCRWWHLGRKIEEQRERRRRWRDRQTEPEVHLSDPLRCQYFETQMVKSAKKWVTPKLWRKKTICFFVYCKNQAYWGWSRCNGIFLVSGQILYKNKCRKDSILLHQLQARLLCRDQIIFGTGTPVQMLFCPDHLLYSVNYIHTFILTFYFQEI